MNRTSPDPSGKKVLLVIGNASRRNLRANVFRDVGIEVICAAHVKEARDLWHPGVYDLVVLDMRLHSDDAADLCSEMKAQSPGQGIAWLVGSPEFLSARPLFDRAIQEDSTPCANNVRQIMANACEALPRRGGFLEARWRMALGRSVRPAPKNHGPLRLGEIGLRAAVIPVADNDTRGSFAAAVLQAEAEQETKTMTYDRERSVEKRS